MPISHQGKNNSPMTIKMYLEYHDIDLFYVWTKCIRSNLYSHWGRLHENGVQSEGGNSFFKCIFLCIYDIVFCVMPNKLSAHIEE